MKRWCPEWRRAAQHKWHKSAPRQKYVTQMAQDLDKLFEMIKVSHIAKAA